MKNTTYKVLTTLLVLLLQVTNAQVKLPAIVSSNMVLQRNTTVKIWGWAAANEKISIKTSWLKAAINVQADANGNWMIDAKTTDSKEPQTISLKSNTSDIKLENILFGEVWLCSGQSNMEMPMKGFFGQPTFGSADAIAKANNPNLRLFNVTKYKGSSTPLKDVEKYSPWQEASAENVKNFSAVGYFFGNQLQEILDVPVGIINTSWGGSSVQAWISKEVMSTFDPLNNIDELLQKNKTSSTPTALFNSMLNPLIPYTIKGVLWYQGEANRGKPDMYKKLFPAMVADWRKRWNIGDFPIYYTQIAPYKYDGNKLPPGKISSAFIREAQLECLNLIPNSGIAITLDIGSKESIHPPKKKEVADRLLYNALNKTYNFKTVDYLGPMYDAMEIKNGGISLKFKNAENGIFSYDEELLGFEIAGEDKVFYPAKATIEARKTVLVKSDKVPNPVAVRYGWDNWMVGSLFGTNLLPASSFRTDNWNEAISTSIDGN
jgi:sialate O-acetylesterase